MLRWLNNNKLEVSIMIGNTFALIRVSTEEQNEARQVVRMEKLGIPKRNIIIEKESGKSKERVKFHRLIKRLKQGDTLYIENLDRLARDYDSILSHWNTLTKQKGVILKILDTPMLDTDQDNNDLATRFMRDIFLLTQAFQAESEWHKIKVRQAQGIAVAKASGKNCGRPKSIRTKRQIKIARQYLNREISLNTALQLLKIKKSTFYKLCHVINGI
ncbi:MAG: recombinase family protein [Candidatus Cloacimonetes bacterium]|nr:recombinase family protein [Candidatus Cloacimonadota bacterium]